MSGGGWRSPLSRRPRRRGRWLARQRSIVPIRSQCAVPRLVSVKAVFASIRPRRRSWQRASRRARLRALPAVPGMRLGLGFGVGEAAGVGVEGCPRGRRDRNAGRVRGGNGARSGRAGDRRSSRRATMGSERARASSTTRRRRRGRRPGRDPRPRGVPGGVACPGTSVPVDEGCLRPVHSWPVPPPGHVVHLLVTPHADLTRYDAAWSCMLRGAARQARSFQCHVPHANQVRGSAVRWGRAIRPLVRVRMACFSRSDAHTWAADRIRSTSRCSATTALISAIFSRSDECVLTSRSWTSDATT